MKFSKMMIAESIFEATAAAEAKAHRPRRPSAQEIKIAKRIKAHAEWSMLPWWKRIVTKKPE